MRILLDEDVPMPILDLLRHILKGHTVDHVYRVNWGSKTDVDLYKDARARRYDVIVTNNLRQLNEPSECDAIKRSGLHVIFYDLRDGVVGLGLAAGAVCAGMHPAIADLANRQQQHLAWITALSANKRRYRVKNPATEVVSPYWP